MATVSVANAHDERISQVKKANRSVNTEQRLATLQKRCDVLQELRHNFLAEISAELPEASKDIPPTTAELFKLFEVKQMATAAQNAKWHVEIIDGMLDEYMTEMRLLNKEALVDLGKKLKE